MAKRPSAESRKTAPPSSDTTVIWRRGANRLVEQGRMMWTLGEGLRSAFTAQAQGRAPRDEESLVAELFGWTQTLLSSGFGAWGAGCSAQAPPPTRRAPRAADPHSPRLALMEKGLAELEAPVMWVGSREVGSQWVTMALTVGVDGLRRVVALVPGSVREQRVADGLVADLSERGLPARLLVITEGSRTLDKALGRLGEGPRVAHCRRRLRRDVIWHLPEASREKYGRELDDAWSLPPEEASALLQDLERRLAVESPGAAERLSRSREASLVVARLGVSPPLKDRLESAGTLRMAFKQGLRWAPPGPGVPTLMVGIPLWLQRARRLVGWRGLELLAHVLRAEA